MRHAGRARALAASWLDFLPERLREQADQLRQQVHHLAPELDETVKWGHLVFTLEGVPVLALQPARQHLNLQLMQGAPWPEPLMQALPMLRSARLWRLPAGEPVDPVLLEMAVAAALRKGQERLDERVPRDSADRPQD